MKLEKSIQELIQKNLPGIAANELSKFIEESKKLEKDLELSNDKIKKQEELIKKLDDIISQLKLDIQNLEKLQNTKELLDIRGEKLRKEEIEFSNKVLSIQLSESINRNEMLFQLVNKVFGHPSVTIIKKEKGIENIPVEGGGNGIMGTVFTQNYNKEITTTETKSKK